MQGTIASTFDCELTKGIALPVIAIQTVVGGLFGAVVGVVVAPKGKRARGAGVGTLTGAVLNGGLTAIVVGVRYANACADTGPAKT